MARDRTTGTVGMMQAGKGNEGPINKDKRGRKEKETTKRP